MATYKKIVDVETVAEATENMNVLVEENGALKKINIAGVGGGGGGIATAIWKDSNYDNALMGVAAAAAPVRYVFSPVNMTYDEALAVIMSGKPLMIMAQIFSNGFCCDLVGTETIPGITIRAYINNTDYFWLPDNTITTEFPR